MKPTRDSHRHRAQISMRNILKSILFSAFVLSCAAGETFIGPTSDSNRLVVQANEMLIFTAIQTHNDQPGLEVTLIANGITGPIYINEMDGDGWKNALAGPLEIKFSTASLAAFHRIAKGLAETRVVPAQSGTVIDVPIGTSVRFFHGPQSYGLRGSVMSGNRVFPNFRCYGDTEIHGPASITLINQSPSSDPRLAVATFLRLDSSQSASVQSTAVSGTHGISIDKSTDLRIWSPVFFKTEESGDKTFFRMTLTK